MKSTARRFEGCPHLWMSGFATLMTGGLTVTGWLCHQTWPYFVGVGLFAAHLGHQASDYNNSNNNSRNTL